MVGQKRSGLLSTPHFSIELLFGQRFGPFEC